MRGARSGRSLRAPDAGRRALCVAVAVFAVAPAVASDAFLAPDWSWVASGFYPLVPGPMPQPVITAASVTDARASFVADPFLFHEDGMWYLFFEATVPVGKIALATSPDALSWTYQRIVLSEPYQLSYPHVFVSNGVHYMTPESGSQQSVRLYRGDPFPTKWTFVTTLVSGRSFADPTVFFYDGLWWMFVGNTPGNTCWLFFSTDLASGWVEHPASPIVADNRARARPGGRAVQLTGGRIHRFAQNGTPTYGRALRVFQVDELTTTTYREHEIAASPIVQAGDDGWNADGMHHCDPWWVGDHWVAAVDGVSGSVWSIGIYQSPVTDAEPPGPPTAPGLHLRCTPNPVRGRATFALEAAAGSAAEIAAFGGGTGAWLEIHDTAGRLRLSRTLPSTTGGRSTFDWDGETSSGVRLPAGVYLCSVRTPNGAIATTRIVVLR